MGFTKYLLTGLALQEKVWEYPAIGAKREFMVHL